MTAFYNEIEPFAAEWTRSLILAGHITPGAVDERSIADVNVADVARFTRAHFFSGIAVWDHALRVAGWPDDLEVWTGSCPCQPFSVAGKHKGAADARHLWPEWFRLIREHRPAVILGEQVASADTIGRLGKGARAGVPPANGATWLDAVRADLEGIGYTFGALATNAASVGAPHIRQRLYWVAYTEDERQSGRSRDGGGVEGTASGRNQLEGRLGSGRMADTAGARCNDAREHECGTSSSSSRSVERGAVDGLADVDAARRLEQRRGGLSDDGDAPRGGDADGRRPDDGPADAECERLEGLIADRAAPGPVIGGGPLLPAERGPVNGFWRNAVWVDCLDGKRRPLEPGVAALAPGTPGRVGQVRAFGNAICAPQAVAFTRAVMQVLGIVPMSGVTVRGVE